MCAQYHPPTHVPLPPYTHSAASSPPPPASVPAVLVDDVQFTPPHTTFVPAVLVDVQFIPPPPSASVPAVRVDDVQFIREVREGMEVAPDMDPASELNKLKKKFEAGVQGRGM